MGVRRCVAASLVVVILVGCSRGPSRPSVTIGSPDHGLYSVDMVVHRLRQACPASKGNVALHLVDANVRHTFTCAAVREPVNRIEALLVQAVVANRSAAARADKIISFEEALGVSYWTRAELTWRLATAFSDFSCAKASGVTWRRDQIAEARAVGENATHWLKVEAAYVAGACPDRLEVLYKTVIQAGQPAVVTAVRAELSAINTS